MVIQNWLLLLSVLLLCVKTCCPYLLLYGTGRLGSLR
jgi:hypothetical protein